LFSERKGILGDFLLPGRRRCRQAGGTGGSYPLMFQCVGTSPGKIQVIISPPGFEAFFEELDVLARQGPPDMGQLVALAGTYGLEIFGLHRGSRAAAHPCRPGKRRGIPMIKLKRAYEAGSKDDGLRILVERLWPRGVSKQQAKIDLWLKDLAVARNAAAPSSPT
jgi:hypothetical protein